MTPMTPGKVLQLLSSILLHFMRNLEELLRTICPAKHGLGYSQGFFCGGMVLVLSFQHLFFHGCKITIVRVFQSEWSVWSQRSKVRAEGYIK